MRKSLYISNFNPYIKSIIFAVLLAIAVCAAVIYIGGVYSSVANKNAVNEKSNKRFEDFYELTENSLDIVFVGSSHSYCTFDPENFDEALGTSSFQLGMPLQHYDATYYTVREVYNYQRPKLVVIEVYWDLLGKDVDLKQALTLFDSLDNPELEREFVNEVFDTGQKLKYYMDIINYQKDYFTYRTTEMKKALRETLNATDAQEIPQGEEYYKSKGYVYCDYIISPDEFGRTNQFNSYDGRSFEINEKQRRFLERTVDLCRENGAEVIFVTAPVANISLTKISNYAFINDKVSKMAESLDVPYIDYNIPETGGTLFENANFRDDAHLNDSGVKILNKHFISWLESLNILENPS